MTEQLTKRQLESMTPEQLRRHILATQHDQNRADSQCKTDLAQAHDTVRQLGARITQLSGQLQDATQAASRETSFYWRMTADIGRALQVDVPAPQLGATLGQEWRSYAEVVRRHVCGTPAAA